MYHFIPHLCKSVFHCLFVKLNTYSLKYIKINKSKAENIDAIRRLAFLSLALIGVGRTEDRPQKVIFF